ncbi:sugar kinase [Gordonia sp. NPDC003424]
MTHDAPAPPFRSRVACVGEGLVVLAATPGPLEDAAGFTLGAGGGEANTASTLSGLGVPTAWMSRVGADGFGRYMLRTLGGRGVDVSGVVVDPSRPTGIYVKECGTDTHRDLPTGDSRMLYYRKGSAASALDVGDIRRGRAADLLARVDLVHVSGITAALSDTARRTVDALLNGPHRTSFDLNYRRALWGDDRGRARRILGDCISRSDIVLAGADEAAEVFGTGDPDRLRRMFPEPEYLVIKNDAHVVTGFRGDERVDVPALTVRVVERIGAGDAFAGGYLAGLLEGRDHTYSIRLGHACAASALSRHADVADPQPRGALHRLATLSEHDWATTHYDDLVDLPEEATA